jgi:hypothetical protein
MTTSTLYSLRSRLVMTSSCSCPTTPTIGSRPAGRGIEHLHQPFLFELLEAFVELFVPRVLEPHAPEMFRRKPRHALELQRLPGMHRVADGKLPGIDEPEDVAGICDLDGFAVAAEKTIRARSPQLLAHAAVGQHHVLFEAARAHTHERDAIAMARIHVRLNLEDEAR